MFSLTALGRPLVDSKIALVLYSNIYLLSVVGWLVVAVFSINKIEKVDSALEIYKNSIAAA
jgi:hypothetical protein